MTRRPPSRAAQRQRGAALLTAMIIVTLVATLASAMIWQQWRAVQIEAAERSRAQSAWILDGALDWARLILREDARTGGADHLGEPWAVPLAEARLSTFLAADRDRTDDAPEAFLAGSIVDAQGRYNLRNLLDGQNRVVPVELETLRRLCESLQIDPGVADRIAGGLAAALAAPTTGPPGSGAILPRDERQLGWLGVDPDTVQRLLPYVALLPGATPLNLNTAPREVIAAVVPGLDLASAERLVQARQRNPLRNVGEAQVLLPAGLPPLNTQRVGIASSHFEVRGRLRIAERVLEERSLVQRRGIEVVALHRERIARHDEVR